MKVRCELHKSCNLTNCKHWDKHEPIERCNVGGICPVKDVFCKCEPVIKIPTELRDALPAEV